MEWVVAELRLAAAAALAAAAVESRMVLEAAAALTPSRLRKVGLLARCSLGSWWARGAG